MTFRLRLRSLVEDILDIGVFVMDREPGEFRADVVQSLRHTLAPYVWDVRRAHAGRVDPEVSHKLPQLVPGRRVVVHVGDVLEVRARSCLIRVANNLVHRQGCNLEILQLACEEAQLNATRIVLSGAHGYILVGVHAVKVVLKG